MASQPALLQSLVYFAVLGTTLSALSNAQETPSAADLAAIDDRLQAVYEQVAPAIVRFAYVRFPRKLPFGSGVIVTSQGHVAISGPVHAVLRDDLMELRLADGRRVRGRALGWSSELGFGLLKITEPGPWPHIDLERKADPKAGQLCVAMGYPRRPDGGFEERLALRLGAVTRSAAGVWLTSSHRFRAGAHSVFDLEGRLLGLCCSTPVGRGRDPVYTSAALIKSHWDDLVGGKNLDRVRLYSLDPGQAKTAGRSEPPTAAVQEPAATAVEKAKAASVRITEVGHEKGLASGVIVTSDGYVITCGHHGRLPGQKMIVSLRDGRDAGAIVLGTNLVSDVALLKITDEGPWPHAQLGHSATMQPGDRCVLIGYPSEQPGREPWVRKSRVIQPTHTLPRRDNWYGEFWTAGYPESLGGASGGGVFDSQGRVIGVLLGGATDEMQHARVELFRRQWDTLAAARPVDVLDSEPLAEITAAFSPIASQLPSIAVEVFADGKRRALGTIVASDGLVLTKASVLAGPVSCRLGDGRKIPARVQKRSRELDLALLKIDAAGLPEARWSRKDDRIVPGKLIAALVPGQQPRAGVVSLAAGPKRHVTGEPRASVPDEQRGGEVPDCAFGTDIELAAESCGGPVIDRAGRVVGIVISCQTEHGGFGQHHVIPASAARKVIAD
jgi:serine protease Do